MRFNPPNQNNLEQTRALSISRAGPFLRKASFSLRRQCVAFAPIRYSGAVPPFIINNNETYVVAKAKARSSFEHPETHELDGDAPSTAEVLEDATTHDMI